MVMTEKGNEGQATDAFNEAQRAIDAAKEADNKAMMELSTSNEKMAFHNNRGAVRKIICHMYN